MAPAAAGLVQNQHICAPSKSAHNAGSQSGNEIRQGLVTSIMVVAFSADSVVRWVWPDPQQYLMHFLSLAKAFGGKAFADYTTLRKPRR
ncbi:MAG TPA: hypothetical protein VGQ03_06190 [Nitrososphaera sp.]|jgi:hypothetical protein|nr:hypothetical protein [Nitrososphaera sp.]